MKIISKTPQKSLDKSLLRFRPKEAEFVRFRQAFATLLGKVDNDEREDNQKTHVHDFLRDAFYRGTHEINSKGTIDLAVYLGADKSSPVGLIVEAKSPGNKGEMLSEAKPNAKALHELVLYYMRERIEAKNDEVKYLIATNINEWFIFAASDFDEIFHRNTKFRKKYEDWRDNQLVNSNTDHFYNEIAKPFIEQLDKTLECTHFDLRDWNAGTLACRNATAASGLKPSADATDTSNESKAITRRQAGVPAVQSKKLIALYKLLSPYHLLKTKFEDDSNTLDKKFYTELLHIIGLEEYKEKSKTLIRRKTNDNTGSLMEMAITMLDTKDVLPRVENPSAYGDTREKRYETIALELCITWTNRILFLKLLEAQLLGYHDGDQAYRFLNLAMVRDFDELFALFHQVLAKTADERKPAIREKYACVPYLNSSLFEPTDLENQTITIESLKDYDELPVIASSILKKLGEKAASLKTLEYLFRFLDAYDFASEGKDDIQSENRSLINASVLGKVFEKINGYKDGSIYTPGFITMYMCRQAIRLAVVQKFKDAYEIEIASLDDLYIYISKFNSAEKIIEFNAVIDSLKICDPAVGSGHFLVSALNEILAIKSELGIFGDETGRPFGNYAIAIANDELIITDRENNLFEYKVRDGKPLNAEMQRLQRALFHEKQKLIENCLFGVDINPNSVKICRLRLWIELLKNAYYKSSPPYKGGVAPASGDGVVLSRPSTQAPLSEQPVAQTDTKNHPVGETPPPLLRKEGSLRYELETLPNIDINIKEGNSLISRFGLHDKFKSGATNKVIADFRRYTVEAKNVKDKLRKDEVKREIRNLKLSLSGSLDDETTEIIAKKKKLEQQLFQLNSPELFEKHTDFGREAKTKKLTDEIAKLDAELAKIENKYSNAFEWRFEFPEVLDDDGSFLGFDVTIGNPPYIAIQKIQDQQKAFESQKYETYSKSADIYCLFYERGIQILRKKGLLAYITSNSWLRTQYGEDLRRFLVGSTNPLELVNIEDSQIFEQVTVESNLLLLEKGEWRQNLKAVSLRNSFDLGNSIEDYLKSNALTITNLPEDGWIIGNKAESLLKAKIERNSARLKELEIQINFGIKTGLNAAFIINEATKSKLISLDSNSANILKPTLRGRDLSKYSYRFENLWMIFTKRGITIENFPEIESHLESFHEQLQPRNDGQLVGRKPGSYKWFEIQDNVAYFEEFEKPKIIWGELSDEPKFSYDDSGLYPEATLFFMVGKDLKYLLAILNSKLGAWYFNQISTTSGMGTNRWKKYKIEQLPIKRISTEKQTPFTTLVDQILDLKKSGGDTTGLERRIDEMVYKLYELTPEEIAIVEGK